MKLKTSHEAKRVLRQVSKSKWKEEMNKKANNKVITGCSFRYFERC